jgi:hypothetical protein
VVAAGLAAFVTQIASSGARSKRVVLRANNQERFVMRRNFGLVVVATALVALFLLALVLALAQGHLPLLALDITEHLFGIVLAVFVFERMLAWREARQWLAAKDWLYLILLETIDDLLKELVPHLLVHHGIGTATIRGVGQRSFVRCSVTDQGYVRVLGPLDGC